MGLLLAVIVVFFLWHGSQKKYTDAGNFINEGTGMTPESSPETSAESGEDTETENTESVQTENAQTENTERESPRTDDEDREQEGTLRFVFAGDVLLSDYVLGAYERGGGIRGVVDEELQQVIDSGDVFMVNQEFPFSSRGSAAPDKQYTFRLPPEKVSLLREMNIDIVTLANNHAMDYGTDALLDTCQTLDQAGILRVGAGSDLKEASAPAVMEMKGKKIGFLGASRVIPVASWNATDTKPGMLTTYDPALLLEEIRQLRERCDYVIVYVHWGLERHERPEEYQRRLGQQYIDAGADLVIGSHPHVLQGLEYYKGKPIVYSLGNFVFGSSIPRTALLTAEWDGEETVLKLIPAVSASGSTKAVTEAEKKAEFDQYMTEISYGAAVENGLVVPQQ